MSIRNLSVVFIKCLTYGLVLIAVSTNFRASAGSSASGGVAKDQSGNVFILEDQTFSDFIKKDPSVLVLFHAPWCHWCAEFMPQYAQAAATIASQGLSVKLAQIDCTVNPATSDAYAITAFPTVKLFLDGEPRVYDGGRRAADVVKWVSMHLRTEFMIANETQLDTFVSSHEDVPIVIGGFSDANAQAVFHEMSRKEEYALFATLENRSMLKRLVDGYKVDAEIEQLQNWVAIKNPHYYIDSENEPAAVLYKGDLNNAESMKNFIRTYHFAAVTSFDHITSGYIFKDGRPTWIVFTSGSPGDAKSALAVKQTKELAKKLRSEVLFVVSELHGMLDEKLKMLLGVDGDEPLPTVRLFSPNKEREQNWFASRKYRPSSDLLESFEINGLEKFIKSFFRNELKPYVKSEPIPEDNTGPVKVLVASQFDELVYNSKKEALVLLYAPWCGHCRQFDPIYEKIGGMMRGIKHIDVMKMDASHNEVPLTIQGYPTVVFFAHDAKKADEVRPIYFHGPRTPELIVRWIAKNTFIKFHPDEVLNKPLPADGDLGDEFGVVEEGLLPEEL